MDEDELQRTLAEELENFLPQVGGAAHAAALLPILEYLCHTEEAYVREQVRTARACARDAGRIVRPGTRRAAAPVPAGQRLSARLGCAQVVVAGANIIDALPEPDVVKVIAMLKRLSEEEWFPPRMSANGLMPVTYKRKADPDLKA